MKAETALAILGALSAAQSVSATWFDYSSKPNVYNTETQCTDKESSGFDWSDLNYGSVPSTYNNYGWSGYTCKNKPYKRDELSKRTFGFFNPKCISADIVPETYSNEISCSKKFSIKHLDVSVDIDSDVEFTYGMPDGSSCRQVSSCSSKGNTVENTQCGGATSVKCRIHHQSKNKKKCGLNIHKINFHCNSGSTSSNVYTVPATSSSSAESTPIYSMGTTSSADSTSSTESIPIYTTGVDTTSTTDVGTTSSTDILTTSTSDVGTTSSTVETTPITSADSTTSICNAYSCTATVVTTSATDSTPVSTETTPISTEATSTETTPITTGELTTSVCNAYSCTATVITTTAETTPVSTGESTTETTLISTGETSSVESSTETTPASYTVPGTSADSTTATSVESTPVTTGETTPTSVESTPVPTGETTSETASTSAETTPITTGETTSAESTPITSADTTPASYTVPGTSVESTTETTAESTPITTGETTSSSVETTPISSAVTTDMSTAPMTYGSPSSTVCYGESCGVSSSVDSASSYMISSSMDSASSYMVSSSATQSSPAPPVETVGCPSVVPQCLKTWLDSTKCQSTADVACMCPDSNFTNSVMGCIQAWGTEAEMASAVEYFQGLCAAHIPSNPALITGVPAYITVPPPTGAIATVTVSTTMVVPCSVPAGVDTAASTYSVSFTTQTIMSTVTVPDIKLITTASSEAALVPGTVAIPAITYGIPASNVPVVTGETPIATGTAAVPSSYAVPTGTASSGTAGSPSGLYNITSPTLAPINTNSGSALSPMSLISLAAAGIVGFALMI